MSGHDMCIHKIIPARLSGLLILLIPVWTMAQAPQTYFLGHSLVNFHIPNMVQKLSDASGAAHSYRVQVGIGANLGWQWTQAYSAQGDIWDTTLVSGGFTHFIFTEAVPLQNHLDWSDTHNYADSFYRYAASHNPGIRAYVYETWHCINSGTPEGCPWDANEHLPWRGRLGSDLPKWEGIMDTLRQRHPGSPLFLAPAGQALAMLYDSIEAGHLPGISSIRHFFSDDIHLTQTGNYFVACLFYALIHERSPEGLPGRLTDEWGTPYDDYPDETLALILQRIAWTVACSYPESGVSCSTTSVDAPGGSAEITVYPNPSTGSFYLESEAGDPVTRATVSHITGRQARTDLVITGGQAMLSVGDVPGVYVADLRFRSGRKATIRLVRL